MLPCPSYLPTPWGRAETPFRCKLRRCPLFSAPEFRHSPYKRSCTVMMVQIGLPPLTTCYVRHLFNTSLKSRVSSSGLQKQSAARHLHVYCNRLHAATSSGEKTAAGCSTDSSPDYLLTPWGRVLLEKLTGSAASQEIPRNFMGTRRFITVFTSARHLSLS